MLNLVKACAPWLSWKTAAVAGLVAVGLALCLGMPGLGLLAGAAPVLLIIACLIPCLIPLALLRGKNRGQAAHTQATIRLTEEGAARGEPGWVGGRVFEHRCPKSGHRE